MISKKTNIIIGLAVMVIAGTIAFATNTPIVSDSLGTTSAGSESINPNGKGGGKITGTTGTYTMSDVQSHNSQSNCWTAINGSVYNLTKWISKHPGGAEAIISLCGTDGTAAFTAQHDGQAKPEKELVKLKIGTISQ